jgi:zinc protease
MTALRLLLAALLTVLLSALAIGPAAAIDIKQVTTPLGLKAWLVEDKSVPVINVAFSFEGGSALEPEDKKGVTSLMAYLLTDGAGSLPGPAFKQRAEDSEVALGFGASLDRLSGSMRVLSANRNEGFELLRLAMTAPRFDPDMVEQRRAQALSGVNQSEQRPAAVAGRIMMATVFAGHPYAANAEGLRAGLKALTTGDLKARAAELLSRTGLVIAVVGDIDAAELSRQIDRAFGGLPANPAPPEPPQWKAELKRRTIVIERPVPQSTVQIAMPGIARNDKDWYAAFVMNHILGGGGLGSRLSTEVREKRGLAYGVSSSLRVYKHAALLAISTASANEKVAEAVKIIRAEMARLRNDGVTPEELADAKTYLAGALPVSLDSSGSVANLLYSLQIDGLPPDHLDKRAALIGAVTADDVRRVARRLLRDDQAVTVVVGKPVGIVPEAAKEP